MDTVTNEVFFTGQSTSKYLPLPQDSLYIGGSLLTNNMGMFLFSYSANGAVQWGLAGTGPSVKYGGGVFCRGNGSLGVVGSFAGDSIQFGATTLLKEPTSKGHYFLGRVNTQTAIQPKILFSENFIYPNPATSHIRIYPNNPLIISVYDVLGNLKLNLENSQEQFKIESLAPGVYCVKYQNQQTSTTNFFIKQ